MPLPTPFSIDRAARIAAAAGRLVMTTGARRAAADAPTPPAGSRGLSERLGVSEPATERTNRPRRTSPLATSTGDTDGDGLPDAWERRYGLDPDNAADAARTPTATASTT